MRKAEPERNLADVEAGIGVVGHDPMVTDDVIRQHGGDPISLDKAFTDSDAVLVISDHPGMVTIASW